MKSVIDIVLEALPGSGAAVALRVRGQEQHNPFVGMFSAAMVHGMAERFPDRIKMERRTDPYFNNAPFIYYSKKEA